MVDVFEADAPQYRDAAGNLREAVGVRVVSDPTYPDAAGNIRQAIGVNIIGGGGGGLLPTQAIVDDGTTQTLNPATGTTPAQGSVNIAVADNVATLRLTANRVALTSGATAPVQNSAGAAIATGTITIANNAVSHIRLPATVAGLANGGSVTVRNTAGADNHTATAIVAAGVLTGVNLAATAAMIDNGDTFTATGGQTINVAVVDGVASMTVAEPFWNPFTVTVGDGDFIGYAPGGIGSITNEPLDGFTIVAVINGGGDFVEINLAGPPTLVSNGLLNALVGISGVDYAVDNVRVAYLSEFSSWVTSITILDVPEWTVDQQVPIVIIPQ